MNDLERARSLRRMAVQTLTFIDQSQPPASLAVKNVYDAIHMLVEAVCYEHGVKFRGEAAHKESIEFTARVLNLAEHERHLLQELRTYRNRVAYEGFSITEEYHERKRPAIRQLVERLRNTQNPIARS